MSANRLHVSNPSSSLLSWLVCSASQTVRRTLKVSVGMRMKRTEDVVTKAWRPRYEMFIVARILDENVLFWSQSTSLSVFFSLLISPDCGFRGGQRCGYRFLLWWRRGSTTKEEESFSSAEVCLQDCSIHWNTQPLNTTKGRIIFLEQAKTMSDWSFLLLVIIICVISDALNPDKAEI